MKRHFFGLFVAIIAFLAGFIIAPIRFVEAGSGHGFTPDFKSPCLVKNFSSSHFERLTYWSCSFDDDATAQSNLSAAVDKYHIIKAVKERYLVSYSIEGQTYFCVLRSDGGYRNDICSPSQSHIIEFEKQRLNDNLRFLPAVGGNQ